MSPTRRTQGWQRNFAKVEATFSELNLTIWRPLQYWLWWNVKNRKFWAKGASLIAWDRWEDSPVGKRTNIWLRAKISGRTGLYCICHEPSLWFSRGSRSLLFTPNDSSWCRTVTGHLSHDTLPGVPCSIAGDSCVMRQYHSNEGVLWPQCSRSSPTLCRITAYRAQLIHNQLSRSFNNFVFKAGMDKPSVAWTPTCFLFLIRLRHPCF